MNEKPSYYRILISKSDITFDDLIEYTRRVGRTPQGQTWNKIISNSTEMQRLLDSEGFTILDIRYALRHGKYPEKHYCVIDQKEIHADTKLRYKVTCCKECEKKLHERINLQLYGDICPAKSDIFKEKSMKTKLRKYGNAHFVNPEKQKETVRNKPREIRLQEIERGKATRIRNIESNPNYYSDIAKKSQQTKIRNGHDANWNNRDKAKLTYLKNYGVENPFQSEQIRKKSEITCVKRYGVSSYAKTEECKTKSKKTCLERYGVEHSSQSNEIKQKSKETCIKTYGVEYSLQADSVKEKSKQTMNTKYGVDYAQQNAQIRKKGQRKYYYQNTKFDSKPELAMYIYLVDHRIDFVFQPNMRFEYAVEEFGISKKHIYYSDFYLPAYDAFIEIKGSHFFDESGKMICPYRDKRWTDEQYENKCKVFEAKHQCMKEHNVKIILDTSACIKLIMNYIRKTYGKNYLESFKTNRKKS